MSLDSLLSNGGTAEWSIRELREIAKSLEDAALGIRQSGINYPLQGTAYDSSALSGGELAPMVPQSIQATLDSTTFTAEHIEFWKMLTQVDVASPLHEYTVVDQHGSFAVDPTFAEGGIGGVSEPSFRRETVKVKYMMEVIQLTDVAIMTGLLGPSASALALRTEQGTLSLTQKLENLLFWSDSSLNANQFDGLYSSIRTRAPANYTNMSGSSVTPQKLQEIVAEMVSPELYSRPNVALCDFKTFNNLVNQAAVYGRHDQMTPQNGSRGLYWGMDKLSLGTPYGAVEIKPVPFIRQRQHPIATAQGDGAPNAITPSFTLLGATTDSQWLAADTGYTYHYIIEMYGDRGTRPTVAGGAMTVATAGTAVQIDFADSAVATSGSGSIKYYKVYRARVASGASAPSDRTQYFWVGSFARNGANSGATRFTDLNAHRPDTCPIFLLECKPTTMQWTKFLPFTRRPIPTLDTTMKFALMLFGAFTLRVPSKQWVVDNCGI